MSKIGKKPIEIPQGVEMKIEGGFLEAKGPKGTLKMEINSESKIEVAEGKIIVSKSRNSREANAIWGLTRALINNLLIGVKSGYEKKLELQGVGLRMSIQGKKIVMALGFSHPVEVVIPETLKLAVEENNVLTIFGADKQEVGQFAANIRALKKVEPYKGKGFRYVGEKVIRKVGKKAGAVK
jgi:large subunit ribosomal protein L6